MLVSGGCILTGAVVFIPSECVNPKGLTFHEMEAVFVCGLMSGGGGALNGFEGAMYIQVMSAYHVLPLKKIKLPNIS